MNLLAFFRSAEARSILERAAEAAGMPLSLHYLEHGEEGPRMASWGSCAACAYVATLPDGRKTCRASRMKASGEALRQQRPMSFLCHMGFACVSSPIFPGEGFVLTFGPYVPMGAAESLAFDVRTGLEKLTGAPALELPITLDDIHHAPVSSVPVLAEWTAAELRRAAHAGLERPVEEPAPGPAPAAPRKNSRARRVSSELESYSAAAIAAAIASGDQPLARELLRGVLAEVKAAPRRQLYVLRGRAVAAAGAVLEALENTGVETEAGWKALPGLAEAVQAADSPETVLNAAMSVLAPLTRRASRKTAAPAMDYQALNDIINARLFEGVTLEEAARQLGETPSAISQRLRRKFGMSYSEYAGRLRISKAKELLRRTKLSATEVAVRVGIADQSNFTKLFKKFEGMTPVDYRQRFGRKR